MKGNIQGVLRLALVFVLFAPATIHAERIAAINTSNNLVLFDTSDPASILATTAITGVSGIPPDPGAGITAHVSAIGFRPSNGHLYALIDTTTCIPALCPGTLPPTTSDNLYTLDLATGAATSVGALTSLVGNVETALGFNPNADRIRVVNVSDANIRLNPDTAALFNDTNLTYDSGDPNAAVNPQISGLAYGNPVVGATTTTVFGIDSNLDILVRLGSADGSPISPNTGFLFTIGTLGINTTDSVGLDISGMTGTAFASLRNGVSTSSDLYTINLDTGAATLVGTIGGGSIITDIAVIPAGTLQLSAPTYGVNENGGNAAITVKRSNGSTGSVSVNVTSSAGTATAGSDFTESTQTVTFADGDSADKTVSIPILDDAIFEGTETVNLTLTNATNGAVLGAQSTAVLNIADDETCGNNVIDAGEMCDGSNTGCAAGQNCNSLCQCEASSGSGGSGTSSSSSGKGGCSLLREDIDPKR
jgi:uncharacterized protein DUF4394/Calx-beta domain-containing protein